MVIYNPVYKCKLCSEKYHGTQIAIRNVAELDNSVSVGVKLAPHHCFGGDIGVGELIGYRRKERGNVQE